MTTLFSSFMTHIALVILSLFTVSSEQITVSLNKPYKNIWSHFQTQNNLISYLCFFDINTSNFSSTNHHLPFLQKCLQSKCTEWILCVVRNRAFENKAECSLSHDSAYLPVATTMCSTEQPKLGDEVSTTVKWTTHSHGTLILELASYCWKAIYYLRCLNFWCSLCNSNEPTGINFLTTKFAYMPSHKILHNS
jgi:hypothetical protein